MAIPQILTFPIPLRGKPSFRKFKNTRKKLKRLVNLRIKAIKSYLLKISRQQYLLTSAYKDLRRATAHNEDIILVSVASTFILVYACAVIAMQFIVALAHATYAMSEATDYDMGLLLVVAGPLSGFFCILLAATANNFMSLAIMDGANRKVYRSIRSTLRRSLGAASRITSAWFQVGIVHFARLLVVLIPIYLYAKWFSEIAVLSNEVLIAAGTAGAVWLLAGIVKYSMVPYIALFEQQYLLSEAFGRSRQLINKQAVVFIVSGITVLTGYIYALYKLGVLLEQWLGIGTNLLFVMGLLAGIIFANGAMVMLYRRRKHARA